MSQNVNQLFQNAQDDGHLSKAAVTAINIPNMGAQIQAGLGIDVDDVPASEVLLIAKIIDDSSSISWIRKDPVKNNPGGPELVCEGSNVIDEALNGSKQREGILTATWLLNQATPQQAFTSLDNVDPLVNGQNYHASGGTPYYDTVMLVLSTLAAKMQEFRDNGVAARGLVVSATDGEDTQSRDYGINDVAKMIRDMGEDLIFLFMGIENNEINTDYNDIARDMGIPDQCVYTPKNTASEIRKAFMLASQSAVRASQSAANFSQAKAGGFGN